MKKTFLTRIFVLLLLFGVSMSWAETEVTSRGLQREIMQDLSQSLQQLIEAALGQASAPIGSSHDDAVHEADKLVAAASMVEDHVGESSELNRKLGITLSEELELLRDAVVNGQFSAIDYHLTSVVDSCIGCHSRLPRSGNNAPIDSMFEVPEGLLVDQNFLIKFYVATRQFDNAMDAIEADIRSYEGDLLEADLSGSMDDYLWIAVRSAGRSARALAFLNEIGLEIQRPWYLSQLVERWKDDLDEYDVLVAIDGNKFEDMTHALTLIDRSRHNTQVPFGREGLITDLVAARILENILSDATAPTGDQLGEIYYQLGLIEARLVGMSHASPYMEFLFEAAIRSSPKGPRAIDALRILEEFGVYTAQGKEQGLERYERSIIRLDALRKVMGISIFSQKG